MIKTSRKIYIKKWKASGNYTTFYICQHCTKKIETPQPTLQMCSSKRFWDSLTQCPKCKKLNFVCVYPSGKTTVKRLDG